MTEQTHPGNGTVAQEAARLIEAMASMARSTARDQGTSSYAGEPAGESGPGGPAGQFRTGGPAGESGPGAHEARPSPLHAQPSPNNDEPDGACSACGGARERTPVACKLCPVCQGIALLRSVRPETVDRLADFAAAVASSLRDMAAQSRGSGPWTAAQPASGSPSGGGATVQDIHVDDEDEG